MTNAEAIKILETRGIQKNTRVFDQALMLVLSGVDPSTITYDPRTRRLRYEPLKENRDAT